MKSVACGLSLLVLAILAASPGCDGSGGNGPSDEGPARDGTDAGDLPPQGGQVVARGDLGDEAVRWNALARAWTRANAAAVQAVVATNSVLYRDLDSLGMSPFLDAVTAATGSAGVLEAAGQDLAARARDVLGSAADADAAAGDPAAPVSLTSRRARDVQALADLGDALATEAARMAEVLSTFPTEEGVDGRQPDLVAAALATLRSATPVGVLAGAVAAAPGYAAGVPALDGVGAGLLDVASASMAASRIGGTAWLPATIGEDGAAGPVPFAGDPSSGVVLRGDGKGAEPADRAVGMRAPADPSLSGQAVRVVFADAVSADATIAPIAAGRACFVAGYVADAAVCGAAGSGLLSEGSYRDPDSGEIFLSKGVSLAVTRAIHAGLSGGDVKVVLPEDPAPPPAPVVAGISPAEGPIGTVITLTGSGFGDDPARVGVTLSHGRVLHPAVLSMSDTSITFAAPDGVVPPFTYPLCQFRGYQDGTVWVTIDGQDSGAAYFKYTGLIPCPPIPTYAPQPPIASPGDEVTLYGVGFASDPAQNLVDFNGTMVVPTAYKVDELLAWDGYGTITFTIPGDAAIGTPVVKVRRLDGPDAWEETPPMEVRLPTVPTIDAGEEAGGLFLPRVAWDVGLPTEGTAGAMVSWVLGGSNLLAIRADAWEQGYVTVTMSTPRGPASFTGAVLSDDRMVVTLDPTKVPILNALEAGDSITMTVSGRELYNQKVRTSAPVAIPVLRTMDAGRYRVLGSRFLDVYEWEKPLCIARGDVLILAPTDPFDVLTAPGIFDGSLVFNRTGTTEPYFAERDGVRGRPFTMDRLGEYTITNTLTGATLPVSVRDEGCSGNLAYPPSTDPSVGLAATGARFGCGGVVVTIPPGALPVPGAGGYRVGCDHSPLQNVPGLPQLTAGSYRTALTFTPEPARLLQPITVEIPFALAGRATPPEIGLMDPSTGLYANLPTQIDSASSTARLVLPAQEYVAADTSAAASRTERGAPSAAPAAGLSGSAPPDAPSGLPVSATPVFQPAPAAAEPAPDGFPKASLNQVTGNVAVYSWSSEKGTLTDEDRRIQVNYVSTPGSAGYVTDAFANEVMWTLAQTYDKMTGLGWAKPDGWLGGWVTVTIADLGDPSGRKGATTAGVFGQPWVTINSRLASGAALKTTVAHEMGHVLQRQYTTNLVLNWIDEASANWIAVKTLGTAADISTDITGALDFPAVAFPSTFNTGYDADQGYAAGAWAIWLDGKYPGSILSLYELMVGNPVAWASTASALAAATGASMASLTTDFATAYWTQAINVTESISLTHKTATLDGAIGTTVTDARPAYSSNRVDVSVTAAAVTAMSGLQLVARGQALVAGQSVEVYADAVGCNGPATAGIPKVATLLNSQPDTLVGTPSAGCLRVVVTNFSGSAATPGVRLVAPRINGLSPDRGKPAGGYPLTIGGVGFGSTPGQVTISGFPLTVTSWTDGAIVATMLNAGTAQGPWDVRVTTAESASTNTFPFTFVP